MIPGLKHDPDDLVARFGRSRGEALVRLVGGAADRVFSMIAKHRINCAAQQCGWIQPAHSAAAADVRSARAMEAMTRTRDALASGEISASATRVLVAAPMVPSRSSPAMLATSPARRITRSLSTCAAQRPARDWLITRPATSGSM